MIGNLSRSSFDGVAEASSNDIQFCSTSQQAVGCLADRLRHSCSLSVVLPKIADFEKRGWVVGKSGQFSALNAMANALRSPKQDSEAMTIRTSIDAFSRKMQSFASNDLFFEAEYLHLLGSAGANHTFYSGRPALSIRGLVLEMDSNNPPWLRGVLDVQKIFPNLSVLKVNGWNAAHVRIVSALLKQSTTLRHVELHDVDDSQVVALGRLLEGVSNASVESLVYAERAGIRGVSGLREEMLGQQLIRFLRVCHNLKSIHLGGGFVLNHDMPALSLEGNYEEQLRLLGN